MTSALNKPHFQDATKGREYLESIRWPDGPVCPHCGQFTVTAGTVFERSKVLLHQWMQAVYLICSSKKGCSGHQLQRTLGMQYKTAWFMSHRLRKAMNSPGGILGSGSGTVEADETFIGRTPGTKVRCGHGHKNAVFSLVERAGQVRSFHISDGKGETLRWKHAENVSYSVTLMIDEARQYTELGKDFADYQSVNHSAQEYVRGDAHTNTVEGFFSIFKRGMYGVYQHCSSHHLHRYTTEFDFRYNSVKMLAVVLLFISFTVLAQDAAKTPNSARVSKGVPTAKQAPLPLPLPVRIVEEPPESDDVKSRADHVRNNEDQDLKAQQSMASSAKDQLTATYVVIVLSTIGTFFLILTVSETRRAARAAQQGVTVASETAERQLRAYIGISERSMSDDKTNLIMIVENAGQTPANNVNGHLDSISFQFGTQLPEDFAYRTTDAYANVAETAVVPRAKIRFQFPIDVARLNEAKERSPSLFMGISITKMCSRRIEKLRSAIIWCP